MKGITGVAVVVALATGVLAQSHHHNHQHLHRRVKPRAGQEIEKRGPGPAIIVTEVVEGPTKIEYVMDGHEISEEEAKKGIEEGRYVALGTSTPTFSAPPLQTTTSTPPGAQYLEHKSSSAAPASSSAPPSPPPASPSDLSFSHPRIGAALLAAVNAPFPNGKLPCSAVPTQYGAIPVPWANPGGWTTLMSVPSDWSLANQYNFTNIVQPANTGCARGMLCSYACPVGYQKTQWPRAQGAQGESIGGLFCGWDNRLYLTRDGHNTLCDAGAGGVFLRSELGGNVGNCRTDYPGNESPVIPMGIMPGQVYPVANPNSRTYYRNRVGRPTSAQYYVNNLGVPLEAACSWKPPGFLGVAGNWAPVNLGVGQGDDGVTYLSIFPNLPTSHAVLNFDIELEGDISEPCYVRSGVYAQAPTGCTVGVKTGGTATFVFKHSK